MHTLCHMIIVETLARMMIKPSNDDETVLDMDVLRATVRKSGKFAGLRIGW